MKDFFSKKPSRKTESNSWGKKPYAGGGRPAFGAARRTGAGAGAWKRSGDRDERAPMTLHRATCNECGASCEVPFKPNGKKPIYCNNCFRKDDGATEPRTPWRGADDRNERPRPFAKPAYQSTPRTENEPLMKELRALNAKMDRILDALTELGDEAGDEDNEA